MSKELEVGDVVVYSEGEKIPSFFEIISLSPRKATVRKLETVVDSETPERIFYAPTDRFDGPEVKLPIAYKTALRIGGYNQFAHKWDGKPIGRYTGQMD